MLKKPIFCATHPRACSSAFERVFLTRKDMTVFHEPFSEPYYYSKERLGSRYDDDVEARRTTETEGTTFRTIFEKVFDAADEPGKRVFVKDMAYYFTPERRQTPSTAPSLVEYKRGVGTDKASKQDKEKHEIGKNGPCFPYDTAAEPGNPTIIPTELLGEFHFTFLIRHPNKSVPSYIRCCRPPLKDRTGWDTFLPSEAGYLELVELFDYLQSKGFVGGENGVKICVLDADDMLDEPVGTIKAYCECIGLDYSPDMLDWHTDERQERAQRQFASWPGWHDDALESTCLKKREHKKKEKTNDELSKEWTDAFGAEVAKAMLDSVVANTPHYEYLKQFAIKVEPTTE